MKELLKWIIATLLVIAFLICCVIIWVPVFTGIILIAFILILKSFL